MNIPPVIGVLGLAVVLACSSSSAMAQAAGVPVYQEGAGQHPESVAKKAASELRKAGALLKMETVQEQLSSRTSCSVVLPKANTRVLPARELWERARKAHMRVGWYFQEKRAKPEPGKSPKYWTLNLSGGYVLTEDGAVATCYHVAAPIDDDNKQSYLLAVDDEEHVYPVTEILAANPDTDTCILRIKSDHPLTPLPLATDVMPGDHIGCFSEPMGKRGYYTDGIVNRYYQKPLTPTKKGEAPPEHSPVWVEVSSDWAMGSSGSAVLDNKGNVIGHVSEISPVVDDQSDLPQKKRNLFPGTLIIFHQAIAASEVQGLIDNNKGGVTQR